MSLSGTVTFIFKTLGINQTRVATWTTSVTGLWPTGRTQQLHCVHGGKWVLPRFHFFFSLWYLLVVPGVLQGPDRHWGRRLGIKT